jgi:hypothetical protein
MEKRRMRIQGRELKDSDKGSKVTYIPTHAEGNAGHKDCEGGTISSWNDSCVFVNYYGTETKGQATYPEDLVWG